MSYTCNGKIDSCERDRFGHCGYCDGDFCEYCSEPILEEPIVTDPGTVARIQLKFCSTDCLRDYQEDKRVGQIEAAREYEVWGNDYDSWYR